MGEWKAAPDLMMAAATGGALTAFIILLCTIIEHIGVIEHYSLRARLRGLGMNLMQGPLAMIAVWPLSNFWHSLPIGKLITVPLWTWLQPLGPLGYALQFLAVAMAADFLVYWSHRAEHKLLWPIHAVHHSPTELYAANDIGHPLEAWFRFAFVSMPLGLVQISGPATPAVVSFVLLLLTYYIHSPIDVHFGALRKVLVDNRFHRIHHSIEQRHFDKNFGVCFSMWDRWFGTAYDPAPDEWPEVGLENIPAPRTIGDYLLLPFRKWPDESSAIGHHAVAQKSCLTAANFGNSSSAS